MRRYKFCERYARLVFELALERNELESWQRRLKENSRLDDRQKTHGFVGKPKSIFRCKKSLPAGALAEINPLAST